MSTPPEAVIVMINIQAMGQSDRLFEFPYGASVDWKCRRGAGVDEIIFELRRV
jgi:hypothetical protein